MQQFDKILTKERMTIIGVNEINGVINVHKNYTTLNEYLGNIIYTLVGIGSLSIEFMFRLSFANGTFIALPEVGQKAVASFADALGIR